LIETKKRPQSTVWPPLLSSISYSLEKHNSTQTIELLISRQNISVRHRIYRLTIRNTKAFATVTERSYVFAAVADFNKLRKSGHPYYASCQLMTTPRRRFGAVATRKAGIRASVWQVEPDLS